MQDKEREKSGRSHYTELIRLGFPILVTQLGIIAVGIADTLMVGKYGTGELAAASFVNNVFLVSIVALLGFAGGMTPIVGAFFGKKDLTNAGLAWKTGLRLNLLMSLGLTMVMGVLFFFLDQMNQPVEIMPLIRPFYLIVLSTILPTALFSCCQQTANGLTDTMMPMWIMVGGNLLNILGNYLLIFGKLGFPELGLMGAGVSTMVSRYLMVAVIFGVMLLKRSYWPLRSGLRLRPGREIVGKVWVTSYPIMIQNGIECSLWAAGAVVCGWFGTLQLASYQIVNTIGQFGFMIYMSAAVAVSIRVANFTGIRDTSSIRATVRAGMHIVLTLALLASLLFIFLGKQLVEIFSSDMGVVAVAMPLIVPLVLYQFFDALQLNFGNGLRGTSDVKPLLIVSVVSYLVTGIGSMWLLAVVFDLGNVGVYYSFNAALLTAFLMLLYYYRRAVKKVSEGEINIEG